MSIKRLEGLRATLHYTWLILGDGDFGVSRLRRRNRAILDESRARSRQRLRRVASLFEMDLDDLEELTAEAPNGGGR